MAALRNQTGSKLSIIRPYTLSTFLAALDISPFSLYIIILRGHWGTIFSGYACPGRPQSRPCKCSRMQTRILQFDPLRTAFTDSDMYFGFLLLTVFICFSCFCSLCLYSDQSCSRISWSSSRHYSCTRSSVKQLHRTLLTCVCQPMSTSSTRCHLRLFGGVAQWQNVGL